MICSTAQTLSEAGQVDAALAMHVEHEAADRHRRIAAIVDQLVPVRVAVLGDVLAERLEQILRVLRATGCARRAPRAASMPAALLIVAAEQARLQAVEMRELVRLAAASDGRRCRRRSGRIRRTPGSAGGAAARPATRPPGNSRPPSPCRIGAALRPVMQVMGSLVSQTIVRGATSGGNRKTANTGGMDDGLLSEVRLSSLARSAFSSPIPGACALACRRAN